MTAPDLPTPTDSLCQVDAVRLAAGIARGEYSALEVVNAHIERIEAVNPSLNAVVWNRYDAARGEARDVDRKRAAGEALRPLEGVPITIKECLDMAGSPGTFGLPSWRSRIADHDEVHVARLRGAGAIVLGKTNVAQCLLFLETNNTMYGRTNHPGDAARSPGGSSGGQAAIIAAGGSPLGLGTDIGGSGRIPAAFCGIVGLKATAGRMPDHGRGSVPIGQLAVRSQVTVFARSVADAALALELAADREDTPSLRSYRDAEVSGMRIGYFVDDGVFAPSAAYRRAIDEAIARLQACGAELLAIEPPDLREAYAVFSRLLAADHLSGILRVVGNDPLVPQLAQIARGARIPRSIFPLVKRLLSLSGRRKAAQDLAYFEGYSADAYWTDCERQFDYQGRWRSMMSDQKLDLVLSPATGLPAVKHGATIEVGVIGSYACLYNLLGWPAGVVPITRVRAEEETQTPRSSDVRDRTARASEHGSAGLPIAVQVAGRPWREDQVLSVMKALHA